MRSLVSRALLFLTLLSPALARENQQKLDLKDALSEDKGGPKDAGAAAGATNSEAISDESTTFNRLQVPPMKELNGDDFDKDVKNGYWYAAPTVSEDDGFRIRTDLAPSRFVKHYSPYCHHCIAIAPTWQTLYEFYYVCLKGNSCSDP